MAYTAKNNRNNELAIIHIAKKELGLDKESYESVISLISNGRTTSSSDLDYAERYKLIEHFKARGWKNQSHTAPAVAAQKLEITSKIGALLADMKLPWAYADGIAKQMFKRQKLQWCTPKELRAVAVALIKQQGKS